MTEILRYLPLLLCGLTTYGVLFTWRRCAAQWGTWFPMLKKATAAGLIAVAIATAFYAAQIVSSGQVQQGPAVLCLAIGFAGGLWLRRTKQGGAQETLKRGSFVSEAKQVEALLKKNKVQTYLHFGSVAFPVDAEPYHTLVVGATGTGKSVAIGNMLKDIRARGDTVIMVDSGGDFLSKNFDPKTDFVFNPYDSRCVGWSPTLEIQGVWDTQAMARSIVPDGVGDSKEWNSYAQTFLGAVLQKLWEREDISLARFLYFVQAAPRSELEELLRGTSAYSQLSAEKTFGSIRTIANNYVSSYGMLPADKPAFSVTQMVQAEHSGVLFLTYRDDQLDSLRHLIACLLDVSARAILSLEPNSQRRVWLIVDEFASIGKVQSIEAMATKSRKVGGALVLGLQSVSQLKDRYGENGAQTILSCLSSWLVLRCSDADTAEYMSRYVGDAEISRGQVGSSQSESGATDTWTEQSVTQRVVMASQIQALKNLTGYLKIAGGYPVCQVTLVPPSRAQAQKTEAFAMRDFKADPLVSIANQSRRPAKSEGGAARAEPAPQVPRYVDKTPRPSAKPAQPPTLATLATPLPLKNAGVNLIVELAKNIRPFSEKLTAVRAANAKAIALKAAATPGVTRQPLLQPGGQESRAVPTPGPRPGLALSSPAPSAGLAKSLVQDLRPSPVAGAGTMVQALATVAAQAATPSRTSPPPPKTVQVQAKGPAPALASARENQAPNEKPVLVQESGDQAEAVAAVTLTAAQRKARKALKRQEQVELLRELVR